MLIVCVCQSKEERVLESSDAMDRCQVVNTHLKVHSLTHTHIHKEAEQTIAE